MFNLRKEIIQNYINGYNQFDIDKMTRDLDANIIFQNIQNDEVNMTLDGIEEFKNQAEKAKAYFKEREQKITLISHDGDTSTIEIDYSAILAIDFSEEMKSGQKLELKGKSVFTFREDKIIQLVDVA
jgi:ketosteroid isomerase-like protein